MTPTDHSADIDVTIFGRTMTVTGDRIREAEGTLAMLSSANSLPREQRDALTLAWEVLRDLRTSPGGEQR